MYVSMLNCHWSDYQPSRSTRLIVMNLWANVLAVHILPLFPAQTALVYSYQQPSMSVLVCTHKGIESWDCFVHIGQTIWSTIFSLRSQKSAHRCFR